MTFVHTQMFGTRTWEVAVPKGTYSVHIVAGDPGYADSTVRFNTENTLVASGSLSSAHHFIYATKTITVSDGRLTISNAARAFNNKLCVIQVTSVAASSSTLSIAASDPTASEVGNSTGTFTTTRSGSTTAPLKVNYLIAGSATNGVDYDSLSGNFTIAAGATSASIIIKPQTDGDYEGTESVILTLQAVAGLSRGNATATASITDADPPPVNTGSWPTTWDIGARIPKQRWESTSVAMDGKIWMFGGWIAAGATGTQEYDVYDVATDTWTDLGYMPVPHTHSEAAADPVNHVIYLAGGLLGNYPGVPSAEVWKYNTLNNTWTAMPSLPTVQAAGGLALVNNELHYFGGIAQDHDVDVATHVYLDLGNLAAGWQSAPDMPDPRDHFANVVVNGKILAIGGEFGHDKLHLQQSLVDSYDPIAKKRTRLAPMPIAKSHDESSTFVTADGKVIVAGGQIDNFGVSNSVLEYDPGTNKWTSIGTLPYPLEGTIVQEVGGKIIVATGDLGTGPIPNTWIGKLP